LWRKYELGLCVNEKAFKRDGMQDVFNHPMARTPIPAMRNVPLSDVLRAVIGRISPHATLIYDGDGVEITTPWYAMVEAREALQFRLSTFHATFHHGIFDIECFRLLGEAGYWHQVMGDHAKTVAREIIAEEKARGEGGH